MDQIWPTWKNARGQLLHLVAASVICATGFATNSETTVIGSMLISPIGGFLLKSIQHTMTRRVRHRGVLASIMVCMVVIPFLTGLAAGALPGSPNDTDDYSVLESRCKAVSENRWLLLATTMVAFGAAMVFGWEESVPVVGVGIATALLPPIVAAGFACTHRFAEKDKRAQYVGYAFAVFALNIVMLSVGTVVATLMRKTELCGDETRSCLRAFMRRKYGQTITQIVPVANKIEL